LCSSHHVMDKGIEGIEVLRSTTDSNHFVERLAETLEAKKARGSLSY
jgi:hypothetical protein